MAQGGIGDQIKLQYQPANQSSNDSVLQVPAILARKFNRRNQTESDNSLVFTRISKACSRRSPHGLKFTGLGTVHPPPNVTLLGE